MKYMMLVCTDPSVVLSPEEAADMGPGTDAWVTETDGRGVRLQGNRLCEPGDATTVRIRGGQTLVSDGPFTETKEQIAGYDLLECENLDEAIEVAAKHPMARAGIIDIRPFWQE